MDIKRISAAFFQVVVVLLGIGALTFMLWEPHLEGRNADATPFEIYFKDPFLACAYAASILFFIALYQAFKLFGRIGRDELFSLSTVQSLRTIRYCTTALIVLLVGAEAYLFIIQRGKDDIAGGVAIGLFMILVFAAATVSARVLERRLQKQL